MSGLDLDTTESGVLDTVSVTADMSLPAGSEQTLVLQPDQDNWVVDTDLLDISKDYRLHVSEDPAYAYCINLVVNAGDDDRLLKPGHTTELRYNSVDGDWEVMYYAVSPSTTFVKTINNVITAPPGVPTSPVFPSIKQSACGHNTLVTVGNNLYAAGLGETTYFYPVQGNETSYRHSTLSFQGMASTATIVDVQHAYTYAAMLDSDGVLYTWGSNANGQLGHGNTRHLRYGKPVAFFPDNGLTVLRFWLATQHETGQTGSMIAEASDGNFYSWGYNGYGQLGLGNTTQQTTPTLNAALSALSVQEIYMGGQNYTSVFLIEDDGQLWAWGYNDANGNLGVGPSPSLNTPTKIPSMTNVVDVKVGIRYNSTTKCAWAIKSDGTVWHTGYNGYGQRGNGTVITSTADDWGQETSGITNAVSMSGGVGWYGTNFVVGSDGTLYGVGYNGYAQHGMNDTAAQSSYRVIDGDVNGNKGKSFNGKAVKVVYAGQDSTTTYMVLDSDGKLWSTGVGSSGQRGNGQSLNGNAANTAINEFPREWSEVCMPAGAGKILDVIGYGATSSTGFLAADENGKVYGWGSNINGALGLENDVSVRHTPRLLQNMGFN